MTYATILHRGFDTVDFALQGALPHDLAEKMATAKEQAIKEKQEFILIEHNGVEMHVADSGMKGGYHFRCDTGPCGATWAFKRSEKASDWNIYISPKSLMLATYGLEGMRQQIYDELDKLGIRTGAESIGRVDYALDFLLPPEFSLDQNAFVSHWHTRHNHHHDLATTGTSGRITSVTLGKMPGRQIIVYDKRADVISKSKDEWWDIWNISCKAQGLCPLEKKDNKGPRVWRVELRAGKRHLKDDWDIRRWPDLNDKLQQVFLDNITHNRYCTPTDDSNRSRWPYHPLWKQVHEEISASLPSPPSGITLKRVKEQKLKHFREIMEIQVAGLVPAFAVSQGLESTSTEEMVRSISRVAQEAANNSSEEWIKKFNRARDKRKFIL